MVAQSMEQPVQRDVVEAARSGDHEAFEALAMAAGDRLFAIACLILRDRQRAEDAVQEALVHAWRELPRLRDPDRFETWLRRLLVNACADEGRYQRRWSAEVRMIRSEPSTDDGATSLADRDQLERGFRRLKPEQRAVVVLHFYVGLPVPEIAETLGIPAGTVKSRLHYATATSRAALEADARGSARNERTDSMIQDRSVDERIGVWLLEDAPSQLPDRVLQATFARTSVSRQRRQLLRMVLPDTHASSGADRPRIDHRPCRHRARDRLEPASAALACAWPEWPRRLRCGLADLRHEQRWHGPTTDQLGSERLLADLVP